MKKYIALVVLLLSSLQLAQAQKRKITGIVSSASDITPLPGVNVMEKNTTNGAITNHQGKYEIWVSSEESVLVFAFIGMVSQEIKVGCKTEIHISMQDDIRQLSETVVTSYGIGRLQGITGALSGRAAGLGKQKSSYHSPVPPIARESRLPNFSDSVIPPHNTEEYDAIHENQFLESVKNPLSTFSIDVDNASYSNMRRYITMGQHPPKDAIRIEEMVNYFIYDYPQPQGEDPFSINTELSDCPWNKAHKLVHIGLQGKHIPTENLPPSNLVFLIDVSGSMNTPERLPLVKTAFKLLVEQLRPQDYVSIVVYAGAAGLVLPPTSGQNKARINAAIDRLEAGGSTAGGAGIKLAYKVAHEHFNQQGNNRVILATDGDFNVGVSSNAEMERLIEKQRETGVFLTVLGFGMGNYKDSKMEILANKGNGNYAYIDNILEAKKVFVNEFGGTLFTIAKDVKLQIEFNPAKVKAYRLIGYENRMLKNEDFNNDKKDAGDLGSGHTVTALYEIIPASVQDSEFIDTVDELNYQSNKIKPNAYRSNDLMTLKLRYKQPNGEVSKLLQQSVADKQVPLEKTTDNFRFSAAVASFGMLLRDSQYMGTATYTDVLNLAKGAIGKDQEGYRAEFMNLVRSMQLVTKR